MRTEVEVMSTPAWEKQTCKKCGSNSACFNVKYVNMRNTVCESYLDRPEWLHVTCLCGYQWIVDCEDKEE
jgi:hypothetical protein